MEIRFERARRVALIAVYAVAAGAGARMLAAAELVDDAQRRVELPDALSRVFAAGAPAELLLYTLVPEMLVGRNQAPPAAALALLPPEYRSLTPIVNLPDRDDPRYDAELVALKPDVYVDYGTVDEDYVAALDAITQRTQVPGLILDGRLANIPGVYRRLGAALGVAERGQQLAELTEQLLDRYGGVLDDSVRVYLACSADGMQPCYEGHSAGEAASWLGARNVSGNLATAPRRAWTLDEIRAAAPDVIIAADAARLVADPAWRTIPAVAAGRVHAFPRLPFNWGPRPPSVNRLFGMIWLAYVLPGRELDAEFFADTASLFSALYHFEPSQERLRSLVVE
jgi:iron complex transport system substrate-binding protein